MDSDEHKGARGRRLSRIVALHFALGLIFGSVMAVIVTLSIIRAAPTLVVRKPPAQYSTWSASHLSKSGVSNVSLFSDDGRLYYGRFHLSVCQKYDPKHHDYPYCKGNRWKEMWPWHD